MFSWVPVNEQIARVAGDLASDRPAGRHGVRAIDYLIAATAMVIGVELVTTNPRRFPMLSELKPAYTRTAGPLGSPAFEPGRPLLGKGHQRLAGVALLAKLADCDRDSSSIAWSKDRANDLLSMLFVSDKASGGPVGEASSPILDEVVELIRRQYPVDQTELGGLRCTDDLGEEGQLLRTVQADQARKQPGRTEIQGETPLGEDLREASVLRGDDQIATERHAHSRTRGDAVHLGDGRFGDAVETEGHFPERSHLKQSGISRSAGDVGRFAEVGSRTERVARLRSTPSPGRGDRR